MHVCVCVYVRVCAFVNMCARVQVCVRVCVCAYVYLRAQEKIIFFVHMGYPQERPRSVRKLQINKPPPIPMSPNLPKPKGKKLTEESLHCCIVFKAKEEKQREGRETAEEKQRKAEEQQRKSRGKGKETQRTSKGNAEETLRKRRRLEDSRIGGFKDSRIRGF